MHEDLRPRILCVDDEPNVLDGLARTLRTLFAVETAVGGARGLEMLRDAGPFVIAVSDLRMPRMTGIQFLASAREVAPDTVRVLLTGQADMESAIDAVNNGNIFRFLTKPCPTGMLVKSLMACVEQHRLVTAERVLLEQTLRGSVKALTEVLALANPAAFGRATRVTRSVLEMMDRCGMGQQWTVEVAAMLSQIGFVILPPQTQDKLHSGEKLTDAEWEMLARVPKVMEQLLSNIPRLEAVREILRVYPEAHAGEAVDKRKDEVLWGARALKIAIDYDALESQGNQNPFGVLRERAGWYDASILEAFAELKGRHKQEARVREMMLDDITPGMFFGQDVKSRKGLLLVSHGQEATPSLLERIRNFSLELGIVEPVQMIEWVALPSDRQPAVPLPV